MRNEIGLVFMILFSASVGLGQEIVGSFERLPQPNVTQIESSFEAFGFRYGQGHYKNALIPFRLHCPKIEDTISDGASEVQAKYPLVVWFHGHGEVGSDNSKQLRNLNILLPILHERSNRKFFLLATQCPPNEPYWMSSSEDRLDIEDCPTFVTKKIIEGLIESFPIDRERISVMGFSDGCNAVNNIILDDSIGCSAALIISGNPSLSDFTSKVPTKIIYGEADGALDEKRILRYAEQTNRNGGKVHAIKCFQKDGAGWRHDSFKAAFDRLRAVEWMLDQKNERKK